jgi:hypothetical protein
VNSRASIFGMTGQYYSTNSCPPSYIRIPFPEEKKDSGPQGSMGGKFDWSAVHSWSKQTFYLASTTSQAGGQAGKRQGVGSGGRQEQTEVK